MLGRHIYRVHPVDGRWTVTKEGETEPRGAFQGRDDAVAAATRLAKGEEPSRVTIDDGDGVILEERLFGRDLSQELSPR
ncbi:MAG TPA: DUF2188 domain-containing protein [Stellaceae bacterium]|nr:DUF2188 domain-containing protein [Stellaceae bacterium]